MPLGPHVTGLVPALERADQERPDSACVVGVLIGHTAGELRPSASRCSAGAFVDEFGGEEEGDREGERGFVGDGQGDVVGVAAVRRRDGALSVLRTLW